MIVLIIILVVYLVASLPSTRYTKNITGGNKALTYMLVPNDFKFLAYGVHPDAIRKMFAMKETPNADSVDLIFSQMILSNNSASMPGQLIPYGTHMDTSRIACAKLATLLDQELLAECDAISHDTLVEPSGEYFVVLVDSATVKFLSPYVAMQNRIERIAPTLAKYCRPYPNAAAGLQLFCFRGKTIYFKANIIDMHSYLKWIHNVIMQYFSGGVIRALYARRIEPDTLSIKAPAQRALSFAMTIADHSIQSNNLDFRIFAEIMKSRGFEHRQYNRCINLLYCAKIVFIKKSANSLYETSYFTNDDTYRHAAISSLIRKEARKALGSRDIWKILNKTRKLMPISHDFTFLNSLTPADYGKYIAKTEGSFLQTGIYLLDEAGIADLRSKPDTVANGGNIMEYVHNPLLIAAGRFAGRKFHIRSYILFSCIGKTADDYYEITTFVPDDLFRIYTGGETYRENGVTKPFSNRAVHITGAATTVHTELEELGLDSARIREVTTDVTRAAARALLDVYDNDIAFECYDAPCGFFVVALDVIIDEDYNAHIMEINENPAFRPFRIRFGDIYERFDMSGFYRVYFEYVVDIIARLFGMKTKNKYEVAVFHKRKRIEPVEFTPDSDIVACMKTASWNGKTYDGSVTDYKSWKASMLLQNINWCSI